MNTRQVLWLLVLVFAAHLQRFDSEDGVEDVKQPMRANEGRESQPAVRKLCQSVSRVRLCDPMDCGRQAPLSVECSRQECWRGLPFPSPGDLPHPGIEPASPALQADSLPSEPPGKPPQFSRVLFTGWLVDLEAG